MAGTRHRLERNLTLRSARAMRSHAGRPNPFHRRHQLRTMVAALRQARKRVQKPVVSAPAGKITRRIPFSLRWRRTVANARAWVARRFT